MPDSNNSFPFYTYSGLLTPEHYKRIGNAIWLFLWFISSTTAEKEKEGVVWGIVLGNKPLKLGDLAKQFGVNEKTIRRWVEALEEHEYIRVTRAPYGIIITVKNSKKYKKNRTDKNVHSHEERTKMSEPDWTDTSTLTDKNVHSNKDITEDITITTTAEEKDPIDVIADRFADLKTIQEGRPSYPTAEDFQVIAQIVVQGVSVSQTIELLEQCFKDFKERKPNGKISSFKYCKDYIMDHYQASQSKEAAKNLAKRRIPEDGNKNKVNRGSAGQTPEKSSSLTGGQVGRIGRRKA